jgi:hypothetical protein
MPLSEHCVGRHSLRLPTLLHEADIATGIFKPADSDQNSHSFDVIVDRRKKSLNDFSIYLFGRSSQLKDNFSKETDVLRLEKKLSESATLFRIQSIEDAYTSEVHFLVNENLVVVKIDSYKNTFLSAEEKLIKFMSNFVIAAPKSTEGFCIGPLVVRGDYKEESGSFYWHDDAGNTLDIHIDTFNAQESGSLLQQMSAAGSLLNVFSLNRKVLRAGKRMVTGMAAEEWLGWANLGRESDEKTFKFTLATTSHIGSKFSPSFRMTFDSAQPRQDGTHTKTNLSDEEAMALWDAIVNSIQPAK